MPERDKPGLAKARGAAERFCRPVGGLGWRACGCLSSLTIPAREDRRGEEGTARSPDLGHQDFLPLHIPVPGRPSWMGVSGRAVWAPEPNFSLRAPTSIPLGDMRHL